MNKILESLSSKSGQTGKVFVPEREDIVSLQRMGRHIHVVSTTRIKGQEFNTVKTSMTGISVNTVRRAVFFYECLKNARWICEALNQELELMHQEMRKLGLILDDDFPPQLRDFFDLDAGQIRARMTNPEHQEFLSDDRVRILLNQLAGVLPFST